MSEREMIVSCVAYAGGKQPRDVNLDEIEKVLGEHGNFVWLSLRNPDEKLLRRVQRAFGLHDLAVEDAHVAHQRPKIETYGKSIFVVLHTAQLIDEHVRFGETHVFVGERYMVSICHGASPSFEAVRDRCEASPQLMAKGPAFALYAIVDFVVDQFIPVVNVLEEELETVEDKLFNASYQRKTTERLYRLKRRVTALRRAVFPLIEVSSVLARGNGLIDEDSHFYFRDVQDHVQVVNEATENMRELLTTALNVNLSLVSVGQNEVVKRLAGWGAILAVPTMVTSLYGMNFRFMPELGWRYGYPAVIAITGCVCFLLYWRLKRVGWL